MNHPRLAPTSLRILSPYSVRSLDRRCRGGGVRDRAVRWLLGPPVRFLGINQQHAKAAYEMWRAGYYYGGYVHERMTVDTHFALGLRRAGAPRWLIRAVVKLVARFGDPEWKIRGVSWGWGGEHFQYSDRASAAYLPRNGKRHP